jgi:ribosomal protein S18 acetylase RimI-like enzyme
MLGITVRDYRTADWPSICRIHDSARAIEVAGVMPSAEVLPMEKAAAIDGFFNSQTWVACADDGDGRIAGFVSVRLPEITWCYVDPALHRQGVGRKLVQHLLPKLSPDGFVLCVTANAQALAFYRSFGFVLAARFPGEIQGYRCQCARLTLPTSKHRNRPPIPSMAALLLAGFTADSPGKSSLGEDGVYYWK